MKKIIGLACLLLIFIGSSGLSSLHPANMHSMQGTWELHNFYTYDSQNVTDTIPTTEGYRQIKMYYNNKVMWTRYVPKDSVEWFGYGSYRITEDRLIETLEYGSASLTRSLTPPMVFEFELILTDDTFSQITIDEEGNRTFSENYKRID